MKRTITLAEYILAIKKLPVYGDRESVVRLMDCAGPEIFNILLGLPGEVGELCEKFKKILRDEGGGHQRCGQETIEVGSWRYHLAVVSDFVSNRERSPRNTGRQS